MKIDRVSRRGIQFGSSGLLIGLLLLAVGVYLSPLPRVNAQATTTVAKMKGLTLSPLRSELDIAPGTSLEGTLTVTNSTDKAMAVSLNAEEFSVINQQYDYAFTQESALAKWVTFAPAEATLSAGESKTVSFTVGVPLTAEPGGRYIGLFASTGTAISDGGIGSRQRVASLLYITVTGDVSRAGHLVSLSSPWAVGGDSRWSVALQNTGTTHFRSRYNVNVQDLLGHDVGLKMTGDALILPGTVRAVSDTLPLPQLPGLYKYIYTIGLGDTPATVETRYVLYLPPAAIVVAIVAIILLVLGLLRRRPNKR